MDFVENSWFLLCQTYSSVFSAEVVTVNATDLGCHRLALFSPYGYAVGHSGYRTFYIKLAWFRK